jgi:hypothetical protein
MPEYLIRIEFTADADDHDEAVEIAKDARKTLEISASYKLRGVETNRIEEL